MKLQWWALLSVKLSEKNLPELLTGEQLHKARCLSSDADSDDDQEVSMSADPRLRGWGAGRVLVAAEEGTPDAMSVLLHSGKFPSQSRRWQVTLLNLELGRF